MKTVSVFGLFCLALGALATSPALAGSVEVSGAVAHYEEDGQNGKRYEVALKMVNTAAANDRLYAARSRIAERAMISLSNETGGHSAQGLGHGEKHIQTTAVELPAGATVALTGHGSHIMLVNPKKKLKAGDTFRLTLFFEQSGRMNVDVTITEGE